MLPSRRRYTPGLALLAVIALACVVGGTFIYIMRPLFYGYYNYVSSYEPEAIGERIAGRLGTLGWPCNAVPAT